MGAIRKFTVFRIIACLLYQWSPSSIQGVVVSHLQVDDSLVIEKVYVQTDRTCYYPDDDIWYKAYLVNAPYNLLSNHSCNLHVELISPRSEIIQSRVIKLDKGLGTGDFHLPENLASGHYLLRAYTNYMRNFGDQLFFTKEILVVNSTDKKAEMNTVDIENKIEITFFPEGGSLIDNVSSLVAFKAINGLGKGCDITGTVYSSNGDSVTSFHSSHLGMGSFNLKPRPGINYSAIVRNTEGLKIKTNLPQSFSKGITLSVSKDQNAGFLFTVRTNAATFDSIKDEDLLLTLSSFNTILKTVHFKIKSLVNTFPLTTEDMPHGVLVATLYGSDTLPFAERLLFHRDDDNISITIKTDKTGYKPRDSVSMSVSLLSGSGTSRRAYISLSAAEALLQDDSEYPSSIASWFLLESDIRGQVEEPSRYFDPSNPERLKELDLLLLTQGWRDFRWKYNKMHYPAENGFVVSGRIRKTLSNKPPENSKVHIGIFQDKRNILMTIMTDESGNFRTQGIDLKGEARLVVSSLGNKDKLKGILILDSLKYEPPVSEYAWKAGHS